MRDEAGNWGELVYSPIPEPSLANYRIPDPALPGRFDHVPGKRAQYPDRFLLVSLGGLFERAWSLCGGFERYLYYLAAETHFVEELTEKLADYVCALIPNWSAWVWMGCASAMTGAFRDNLMVRPEVWRKLYKKHYRRIFETIRAHGFISAMHSCGQLTKILPDLIEIGLQVYHPLQPEAMDVARRNVILARRSRSGAGWARKAPCRWVPLRMCAARCASASSCSGMAGISWRPPAPSRLRRRWKTWLLLSIQQESR